MCALVQVCAQRAKQLAVNALIALLRSAARASRAAQAAEQLLWDRVTVNYSDCVRSVQVVPLSRAAAAQYMFRDSPLALYADYVLWCMLGSRGWLLPARLPAAAGAAALAADFAQAESTVFVEQRWGARARPVLALAGPPSRRGMAGWDRGGVLDMRVGSGAASVDVSAALRDYGSVLGCLTPRELVVLLYCMGSLDAQAAVRVLAQQRVDASIVLDGTLEEVSAVDGEPVALAS